MSVKDVKIDKNVIRVFSSFAEADAEDKKYWLEKTPDERLAALELMRQSAYGYEYQAARRLQRVFEVVKGE